MPKPRTLCLTVAGVLWALGIAGVLTLGSYIKVNIALMLIAFGSAFLVAALVLGPPRRAV
jgi:NADH:ubiquinone oxidoreductase subunit K